MAKQEFLARAEYSGPAYVDDKGEPIHVFIGDTIKVGPDHTLVQARVLYDPKHESQAGVQSEAGIAARKKRQETILADRAKAEAKILADRTKAEAAG